MNCGYYVKKVYKDNMCIYIYIYIYIWAKRDILLALGINMKYSTLKRVTQEYYTQFS